MTRRTLLCQGAVTRQRGARSCPALVLTLPLMMLLSACAAPSSSVWWNPTTWGTARPAMRVDAAQERVHDSERRLSASQADAMRAARDESHKTAFALEHAPADNKAWQWLGAPMRTPRPS
jgi:type IV pilus biogenesis protein CpaD/CtpE